MLIPAFRYFPVREFILTEKTELMAHKLSEITAKIEAFREATLAGFPLTSSIRGLMLEHLNPEFLATLERKLIFLGSFDETICPVLPEYFEGKKINFKFLIFGSAKNGGFPVGLS